MKNYMFFFLFYACIPKHSTEPDVSIYETKTHNLYIDVLNHDQFKSLQTRVCDLDGKNCVNHKIANGYKKYISPLYSCSVVTLLYDRKEKTLVERYCSEIDDEKHHTILNLASSYNKAHEDLKMNFDELDKKFQQCDVNNNEIKQGLRRILRFRARSPIPAPQTLSADEHPSISLTNKLHNNRVILYNFNHKKPKNIFNKGKIDRAGVLQNTLGKHIGHSALKVESIPTDKNQTPEELIYVSWPYGDDFQKDVQKFKGNYEAIELHNITARQVSRLKEWLSHTEYNPDNDLLSKKGRLFQIKEDIKSYGINDEKIDDISSTFHDQKIFIGYDVDAPKEVQSFVDTSQKKIASILGYPTKSRKFIDIMELFAVYTGLKSEMPSEKLTQEASLKETKKLLKMSDDLRSKYRILDDHLTMSEIFNKSRSEIIERYSIPEKLHKDLDQDSESFLKLSARIRYANTENDYGESFSFSKNNCSKVTGQCLKQLYGRSLYRDGIIANLIMADPQDNINRTKNFLKDYQNRVQKNQDDIALKEIQTDLEFLTRELSKKKEQHPEYRELENLTKDIVRIIDVNKKIKRKKALENGTMFFLISLSSAYTTSVLWYYMITGNVEWNPFTASKEDFTGLKISCKDQVRDEMHNILIQMNQNLIDAEKYHALLSLTQATYYQ